MRLRSLFTGTTTGSPFLVFTWLLTRIMDPSVWMFQGVRASSSYMSMPVRSMRRMDQPMRSSGSSDMRSSTSRGVKVSGTNSSGCSFCCFRSFWISAICSSTSLFCRLLSSVSVASPASLAMPSVISEAAAFSSCRDSYWSFVFRISFLTLSGSTLSMTAFTSSGFSL